MTSTMNTENEAAGAATTAAVDLRVPEPVEELAHDAYPLDPARIAEIAAALADAPRPAAVLRGTSRGLELVLDGRARVEQIAATLVDRLAEAPAFFRGSDVRVSVEDGPLPAGCLARLDQIAARFELRVVEIGAVPPTQTEAPRRQRKLARGSGRAVTREMISKVSDVSGRAPIGHELAEGSDRVATREVPTSIIPEVSSRMVACGAPMGLPLDEPVEAAADPDDAIESFDEVTSIRRSEVSLQNVADVPRAESSEPYASLELATADTVLVPLASLDEIITSAPANTNDPSSLDKLLLVSSAVTGESSDAPVEVERIERTRVVVGPIRSGVILDHRGHVIVFGDVNPGAEVRAEGNIVVLGRLRGTAHAGIGQDVGFILALRLEPQQLRIGRMVARASDSDTAALEPEIARITNDSIIVERYQGRLPRDLISSI